MLFGIQVAVFLGAHAATRIGLNAVGDFLGIFIERSINWLVFFTGVLGWYPQNIMIVFLSFVVMYYAVAVVIAIPGRVAYRFGHQQFA